MTRVTAKALVRRVVDRRHPDAGCGDHGCIFGHAGGMGTNGGCACLNGDKHKMKRAALILADVARVLASVVSEDVGE